MEYSSIKLFNSFLDPCKAFVTAYYKSSQDLIVFCSKLFFLASNLPSAGFIWCSLLSIVLEIVTCSCSLHGMYPEVCLVIPPLEAIPYICLHVCCSANLFLVCVISSQVQWIFYSVFKMGSFYWINMVA